MWWQDPDAVGHVAEARVHFDEADRTRPHESATRICDLYFRGLNKLWNALPVRQGEPAPADNPAFVALLRSITPELQPSLLRSAFTAELAGLTPEIIDRNVLKQSGYRPGQPMSENLRRKATASHRKFCNAHADYLGGNTSVTAERVLKRLAELQYVVRSNIAHGEKVPYGPDFEKVRRDEQVSAVAIPVLTLIVELLLADAS
jgi:hypothetical protein